jgi:hypothetical protein
VPPGGGAESREPEFKTESAKESFEKGKTHFASGEYKDAGKAFKTAQSGAKEKEDKDIVKQWMDAAAGASALPLIDAYVKGNKLNAAYDQLLLQGRKYASTPAAPLFQERLRGIEAKLFHVLESFDQEKSSYSPEYGKTYVNDPKFVYKGQRCLRWTHTKDGKAGMLKLTPVPRDWRVFDTIELWVLWTQPTAVEAYIVSDASKTKKDPTAAQPRADVLPVFQFKLPAPAKPGQWQHVVLRVNEFKPQGGATLEAVTDFRLQIPGGRSYDFLIDEVRLRRKDPAPEGAAAQPGRKR